MLHMKILKVEESKVTFKRTEAEPDFETRGFSTLLFYFCKPPGFQIHAALLSVREYVT